MIEDKELRDLFRMECEEHLQCLDDGLLSLEQRPADQALLEDIFRAAHSIKGSARMLGLNEIQSLAHILEDALGAIRKGAAPVDKNMTADLYQKLAVVRHLVGEAVGEPMGTDALPISPFEPISEPKPVVTEPAVVEQGAEAVSETPKPESAPVLPAEPVNIPEAKKTSFQIGTLRVDPQRLDVLLTHAGELAVTNAHIARRLLEIDTLVDSCEEWTRGLKAMGLSIQDENFTLKGLSQLQTLLTQLRSGLYEDKSPAGFCLRAIGEQDSDYSLITVFNHF